MKQEEIYKQIKECVKDTYNYDVQLMTISRYIAENFQPKSKTTFDNFKVSSVNEQKLIDLCFSIALTLSTKGVGRDSKKYNLTKLSQEEKSEWIAKQLRDNGFDTQPVGCSHGVLVK